MSEQLPAGEAAPAALLEVSDLRVSFATPRGTVQAVDGVSFSLRRGETLAIVGESGSGKSVCALSLLGLTRSPRTSIEGRALLDGQELIGASEAQLRRVRGARMAMIFQDPQSSLNPVLRVGHQIAEQILAHEPSVGKARALERAGELMERVGIPNARARVRAYPHELSGGMRQRVMIAMALSLGAPVLLADEPTTALDVTVQAQILAELSRLRSEQQLGIVLITHDFAVVAEAADRVAVMRAGQIVEHGPAEQLLRDARHPYTRELLGALTPPRARPVHRRALARPEGGGDRREAGPLVELEGVCVEFGFGGAHARARVRARGTRFRIHPHASPLGSSGPSPDRAEHEVQALAGVSLSVYEGETLAVVGESGCGKTTLLRSIARLIEPTTGAIRFGGADVTHARRRVLAPLRAGVGMVFQDPQASLNPRRRVGRTVELALRARGAGRADLAREAVAALERVGLTAAHAPRYPHELSGGERQRVGIARALAGAPRLVLLDEPVTSLDASLRRGVIELLAELQEQIGCSYVLVSHDLAMVAGIADRIAVMHAGEIVECGEAEQVLERPQHPYTRELLAARPKLPGGVGSSAPWAPTPTSQTTPQRSFSG
jgi:peptide/nickel transport system ATP-binding protein